MIVPFDYVPTVWHATGHVGAPVDGEFFIVGVNGEAVIFELDNNGSVGAGRVLVPIGGSAAAAAVNLAAAITLAFGTYLTVLVDGAYFDVFATGPDVSMAASAAGGASALILVLAAQHAIPSAVVMIEREAQSLDVTRGKIVLHHRLDFLQYVNVNLIVGATEALIAWTGTVTSLSGRIELVNGGATPYVAGNVFKLICYGDRYDGS